MTTKRFGKRFIRISGYVLGFLVIALVAFHFWFKAHARNLIEDLVESRSNGKLRLKVDKFSFNWFTKKMEFQDAVFISTDTTTASTSYRFSVDRIKLKVDAILPIVFRKRIIIDTLTLLDPDIIVTRLKRNERKEPGMEKDVSIPEEMGKVYNSIQDALKVLRVSRFLIDRGKFTLVNKIDPGQRPITIGNIFFQIDNLSVDTTIQGARDKILFSDNVILRSHDQDIIFPDERHKLSFRNFSIDLQKKLVEFDSCTIAALRTDSTSAAFTMYMDALKLIDIDFDTLYKSEVIKADSVYCVNPRFNLDVIVGRRKDQDKPPQKLEDIIKQLTGNLQLDNVVVSNADFNINTVKNGVPSTFTFSKNNFDMQGLTIDQAAKSPIKVKSFAMAIRNYENFIRDSSYSVQFDSVLFRDDRIYLSNFVFHKLDGRGRIINTFNIPQFYLGGLSWDDLVFERKLKADQATLFYPKITYTVSPKLRNKSGGTSVFQSLASINEMMDLEYLDIIDGNIDLRVNDEVQIHLEQATLSIESHNLLKSTQIAGIKNSLTSLDFRKGTIHAGDIVMKLNDIRYLGKSGHFSAGVLHVNDRQGKLSLELEDVLVDKMLIDEKRGDIYSEKISWAKGAIRIRAGTGAKGMSSILDIRDVHGKNTRLTGEFGSMELTTLMKEISFDKLDKRPGQELTVEGLVMNGESLKLRKDRSTVEVGDYFFTDGQSSQLRDVSYSQSGSNGSTVINASMVTFTPFLKSYISGDPKLNDVVIDDPRIEAELNGNRDNLFRLPGLSINSLTLNRPQVNYSKTTSAGKFLLKWQGEKTHAALVARELNNRKENGWDLSLGNLHVDISGFSMVSETGKKFNTGNGSLEADLRDIGVKDNKGGLDWHATVTELKARDILMDSIGKKKNRLYIGQMLLKELGMNTASIVNLENLTKANARFRIDAFNGELTSATSVLKWYQGVISRPNKSFSMDSMSWNPRESYDSFMSSQKVQKDYIEFKTGQVRLENADIESFIRDNSITGTQMHIDKPVIRITRDKRLPYDSGRIKALPVDLLRKINTPVDLGELLVKNGTVYYSEIPANGIPATIPITDLTLTLSKIKNADFYPNDSLDAIVSGRIFDSISVDLQIRESYQDTLAGFRMQAQFGKAPITALNPVLVALGSVYIRSGSLDTASLQVIAHEYFAYGQMEMKYHDLRIQILKEPGSTDPANTKKFLSFLANTFVIRNKNKSKPIIIFLERNRERSIFNYIVKIATKGFQTGIGAGNSRKNEKKYKNELKRRELPGISFE